MAGKILVIGKYYYPAQGGIEESTRLISEELAKHHEVKVLVFNHKHGNKVERILNVLVDRRHSNAVFSSQPISMGLARQVFVGKWDIIYFHAPNVFASFFLLLKYKFAMKRPKLIIFHHMDIYGRPLLVPIARYLYNQLIGYATKLIVTSQKNHLVSNDIYRSCDVIEIPLGVDPDSYLLSEASRQQARDWRRSIAGNSPVVGFVGRHARYKGLSVLVRAIAAMPGVHAFIAGDGPERAPSEALARELGVIDRIHFFGSVTHEEKRQILASIDVFAFPSTEITEAFGISQLEAMVVGTPVVASNIPTGVTDVAIDGETALLVEPGSVDSLREALTRLINEPNLARALADRAQRSSYEKFTIELMARRNLDLVNDVLISGNGA